MFNFGGPSDLRFQTKANMQIYNKQLLVFLLREEKIYSVVKVCCAVHHPLCSVFSFEFIHTFDITTQARQDSCMHLFGFL